MKFIKCFLAVLLFCGFSSVMAQENSGPIGNKDVIDMVKMRLPESVIIAKMQTSDCAFDTSVEALKNLSDSGVGSAIIVEMLRLSEEKNASTEEADEKPSGLFYTVGGEVKQILPTTFSGNKVNTLASSLSYGFASTKMKSYISGEESKNKVDNPFPEFSFRFATSGDGGLSGWWFSSASSPDQFMLVKLSKKRGRRELVTGKVNIYSGTSMGVDGEETIPFFTKKVGDAEYKVIPQYQLAPGEYCFFFSGVVPAGGFSNHVVFDFSVPEGLKKAQPSIR